MANSNRSIGTAEKVSPAVGPPAQELGLWDTVSIIVGIVIGTSIFRTPMMVFQNVEGPWQAMGVWLLGGILCLFGAFCYGELATTYPRNGGDYEYLSRAYGRWMGFLFGWAQLVVILTGSIGIMAYAFADYAGGLWSLTPAMKPWIAAAAVAAITALNLFGLAVGKSLQNLLTGAKVLGLAGVVLAGLLAGRGDAFLPAQAADEAAAPSLGLALVFVLYAFGGWNDAVFVAAEVRHPRRNLPRSLILSIAGITLIYLAANAAYLSVLGFDAAPHTPTPAAEVLQRAIGPAGGKAVSLLVMISALGAINGMTLAGSRVYATVGEDHRIFAWLGRWSSKGAAPAAALVIQGCVALLMICAVGTAWGRGAIDAGLFSMGLTGLPWKDYFGGFETLVAGTAPVFWAFFLLTGVGLFVLRATDGRRVRPFAVPWFPLPPVIFCCTCGYMLYSSLAYAKLVALIGLVPLLIAVPLYWLSGSPTRTAGAKADQQPEPQSGGSQ